MIGCGGLFRDWFGNIISAFSGPLQLPFIIYAELYALYYVLKFCRNLNFYNIWINEVNAKIILHFNPKGCEC